MQTQQSNSMQMCLFIDHLINLGWKIAPFCTKAKLKDTYILSHDSLLGNFYFPDVMHLLTVIKFSFMYITACHVKNVIIHCHYLFKIKHSGTNLFVYLLGHQFTLDSRILVGVASRDNNHSSQLKLSHSKIYNF